MSSQERQEIIAALRGAGEPLSVSQIMAAVERTDRNAVDVLLHRMRKAGELELAGRGLYVLGKIDAPARAPDRSNQVTDLTTGLHVAAPDADSNLTHIERPESQEAAKEVIEDPWALSATDLARHAERFRAARKEKGEMIATRALRWELQGAGVLYEQLGREVDRIRQMAETCYIEE